ncbi:DPOD3 polymerase, partial [Rhinopomastus cyanomelas]|nr:DPOD3 polymerase [Rhinopomastus cyanomelas]
MEDELYLENIDEFVTDQNRIVTYKWLSYTLGVHVNQAKQMLYDYTERKRKENSGAQLHVTYLVAGNLMQNGHMCHKVAVVREDQLEAMKSKLATIASVHVYSIQKALLKDSGPLYNTDYDIVKTNLHNCSKFSAIHCAAAVPRPPAEVSQAQTSAQTVSQPPSDAGAASGPAVNGHGPSSSTKQTSQQPRGIMGMFAAKAASKPQETSKETKAEAKEAPGVSAASSKPPAKGNLINNFFGKAAMNKLKVSSVPEPPKEEKEAVKPSPSLAEPQCNAVTEKPGKRAEATKMQQQDKKSKMKRLDKSDHEEDREPDSVKRRRKRIKQPVSDSSDEEDVQSPPTPEEEPTPPTPPVPAPKTELELPPAEVGA